MPGNITYTTELAGVDWDELKATLAADQFDNGRSAQQLLQSFRNSYVSVVAHDNGKVVGTARAVSDGVCNGYIVDVWTLSQLRRRGIGRRMIEIILDRLEGQHVYLFTGDVVDFYKKLGFVEQPVGLGRVVGAWLNNEGPDER